MKILQFYISGEGQRLGVLRDDKVTDITSFDKRLDSTLSLIQFADELGQSILDFVDEIIDRCDEQKYDWEELLREPTGSDNPYLGMPIFPPEVWGFGVTYKRSADFRSGETSKELGIYDRVYVNERPEIFFKATLSRCAGPNTPICIRKDSQFTAPEPELAFVLGRNRNIVGYTLCNDVSAWDIERENPLYLPQSKIYQGCCSIGPIIVTSDEIPDPYNLDMTCRIQRDERVLFEGSVNTGLLNRKFDKLNEYLYRDNPIPIGTVVSTGTGIIITEKEKLKDGDIVEISVPEIGIL